MNWPLISTSDFDSESVNKLLSQAEHYRAMGRDRPDPVSATLALLFYETSLRTRVGFTAAAHRLGISTLEVNEARASPASMPESWEDTLRTVAGYADVVVARPGFPLNSVRTAGICRAFISGGDSGPEAEHPTQALIDLYAMRVLTGGQYQRLVFWGDPRMRAARSLMKLLAMMSRPDVYVVASQAFLNDWAPPTGYSVEIINQRELASVAPDVLYVVGMPHASIPLDQREKLIVTSDTLKGLPNHSIVLCPLPVIDEISHSARTDPRIKMFEQSDLALYARMALLEAALEANQRHA